MKKQLWWIGSIVFFLIFSTNLVAEETIRLTTGEFPPYLSKKLKYGGVSARIVIEAFALVGIKAIPKFYPWKRAYYQANKGGWDGSFTWYYSEKRAKDFYYSIPVIEEKVVFYHLKSFHLDWNTLDDLQGILIGATLEYTYTPEFYAAEKRGSSKYNGCLKINKTLEAHGRKD